MTAAQFKKCAKFYGVKVQSARRIPGNIIAVTFSRYLDENGWACKFYNPRFVQLLSKEVTQTFADMDFPDVLCELTLK